MIMVNIILYNGIYIYIIIQYNTTMVYIEYNIMR